MADIKINSIDWWKTQGGTKNDIYDIQREVLHDILGKPAQVGVPFIFTDAFNQALVDSTGKSRGVPIIDKVNHANRNRLTNFLLEGEIGRFLVDGDSLIDGYAYSDDGQRRTIFTGIGFLGDGIVTLTFPFDLVASDVITAVIAGVETLEPFVRTDASDLITLGNTDKIWGIEVKTSAGVTRVRYECIDSTGTNVIDNSGNGDDATLSSDSVWATGETYGSYRNAVGYALSSDLANIFIPLLADTTPAYSLNITDIFTGKAAQRIKMTDGLAKSFNGSTDEGLITLNTPLSVTGSGPYEFRINHGALLGLKVFFSMAIDSNNRFLFYHNGAIPTVAIVKSGTAITYEFGTTSTGIDYLYQFGFGADTNGERLFLKRSTDQTVDFDDIAKLTVTSTTNDATVTDFTATKIYLGESVIGGLNTTFVGSDFKTGTLHFPMQENGGHSYSTDFTEKIVWANPLSGTFNVNSGKEGSFYNESQSANSGFMAGVNTNQVRIDLAAISAGNNFDVEILNVDAKTADQGYLFQTLTGDAYRLYIHTDGNLFYEVEDSGLVDSGYTHVDGDSYKLLFNNGVIDLEVNGVNQATDTCTATTLTQGILMMYNSSAGTISLRGTSAGFNIYELSLLVASWRGETTTITREEIALTNYAGARIFLARGSNNRDQYGKKIDFASIPITGFDLDKEELTPELEPVVDTNILNTAYTDGLTSMVRQLLHPGYVDRLLLFSEDIALEIGPLIANLIAARNLISDPLVDLFAGIGNPFSDDLAEFAIVDSGADGSLAGNGGGVADLQTGVTNTGGNDGINKTSIVIISGHNILTVAKFMRTDNLTSGTARYEGDIATSNFFNAATAGLVSGLFKEGKNYDLSTGAGLDVYITPLGTFALPNGLKVRELRSYDLTINQAAA